MYTAIIEEHFKASHTVDDIFPVAHSHDWVIRLCLKSETLIAPGVIVDYFELKILLEKSLPPSGEDIGKWSGVSPTAENLAKYFYEQLKPTLPKLSSVSVGEFPSFLCEYTPNELHL